MVIKTNITEMFGIKHPIFQAPMGPEITKKLAMKVSEAGGMGVIGHGAPWSFPGSSLKARMDMKKELEYVIEHTDKPFGFNLRTGRMQRDAKYLCSDIPKFIFNNPKLREQCVYAITSAGSPRLLPQSKNFQKLKSSSNIKHFHVAPALWLADKCIASGVDGLVVTGGEGGGHQSYEQISTLVLLQQVTQRYPDIPVIACGGFATGQGLASALAGGAGAIVMGTRFIACTDSTFPPAYKNLIPPANAEDTVLTSGLLGPVRLWKNEYTLHHGQFIDKVAKIAEEQAMSIKEMMDYMSHWRDASEENLHSRVLLIGQTIGLINSIESAKDIIESVVDEAEKRLKKANSYIS